MKSIHAICSLFLTASAIQYIPPLVNVEYGQSDKTREFLDQLWPSLLKLGLMGEDTSALTIRGINDAMINPDLALIVPNPELLQLLIDHGLFREVLSATDSDGTSNTKFLELLRHILGIQDSKLLQSLLREPHDAAVKRLDFNPIITYANMQTPDLLRHLRNILSSPTQIALAPILTAPPASFMDLLRRLGFPSLLNLIQKVPFFQLPAVEQRGFPTGDYYPMYRAGGKRHRRGRRRKQREKLDDDFLKALAAPGEMREVYDNLLVALWPLDTGGDFYLVRKDVLRCVESRKAELGKALVFISAIDKGLDEKYIAEPIEDLGRAFFITHWQGRIIPTKQGRMAYANIEKAIFECVDDQLSLLASSMLTKSVNWVDIIPD